MKLTAGAWLAMLVVGCLAYVGVCAWQKVRPKGSRRKDEPAPPPGEA